MAITSPGLSWAFLIPAYTVTPAQLSGAAYEGDDLFVYCYAITGQSYLFKAHRIWDMDAEFGLYESVFAEIAICVDAAKLNELAVSRT